MRPSISRLPVAALTALVMALFVATLAAVGMRAAGPPYPPPVAGQRVYDTAGVLSPSTIAQAEAISRGIEARTGAQVVVYTQVKPESDTPDLAAQDAADLIDQWGIGRKGFDDGLVILYDLDESRRHGQVQLYAGPGYEAAFLSNAERQAIFENDMLPLLRGGDLDGALLAALAKVDASATPEHAQALNQGRIVNAILGLVFGPGLFLVLVGLGRLPLAALRPRPRLRRRPVGAHAGPAGRPHRGRRCARLRRQLVAPCPHHRPARPRQSRRAPVPGPTRPSSTRRSRSRPRAARRRATRRPPSAGSTRAGR